MENFFQVQRIYKMKYLIFVAEFPEHRSSRFMNEMAKKSPAFVSVEVA